MNLAEMRDLRERLADEVMDIDVWLSSANVKDDRGRRLLSDDWHMQRQRKIKRKQQISRELRQLKRTMRHARLEDVIDIADIAPTDTEQLLRGAQDLLQRIDRQELDEEEVAFLDVLRARVRGDYPSK